MKLNTSYLPHIKAEELENLHDIKLSSKNCILKVFENAIIEPYIEDYASNIMYGGGVINNNNNYIASDHFNSVCKRYPQNKFVIHKNYPVVYLGIFSEHWGHLLIEYCTRLWILLHNHSNFNSYKFIFSVSENQNIVLKNNFLEFFQFLGLENKIEFVNQPTQFVKVVVPSKSYCVNKYYTGEYLALFSKIIKTVQACSDKHIQHDNLFITRRSYKNDSHINLKYLESFYRENGYYVIVPENITLRELCWQINHAKKIVCLSGTLAHNLLFLQNKCSCIILERGTLNNRIQPDINIMKNLDVTYVQVGLQLFHTAQNIGPFIYANTEWFKDYIHKHKLTENDLCKNTRHKSNKFLIDYFRNYLKFYKWAWKYQDTFTVQQNPNIELELCLYAQKYFSEILFSAKHLHIIIFTSLIMNLFTKFATFLTFYKRKRKRLYNNNYTNEK